MPGNRVVATSDGSGTSLIYAHTVAGTTDLALWGFVSAFSSGGSSDPTGVTYAGAALTELADYLGGSANDNAISLWRRIAPATGVNNVVVTHSATHDITALSISFDDVDQTTPNDAPAENDTTSDDPTHAIASETGDVVVDFASGWGLTASGFTHTGDGTERLENNNLSGVNSVVVADAPGAASVTMSWDFNTAGDHHGQLGFNVNAVAAGGPEERALTGTQPAASGVLAAATAFARSLTGFQPAATGTLTRLASLARPLTGSQPAGSGALTRLLAASRALTGVQPAASGGLEAQAGAARALDGVQPAGSGLLARLLVAARLLTGSQPAPAGTLVRSAFTGSRALAGTQPAAGGLLLRQVQGSRTLAGMQPAATGLLQAFLGENERPAHVTLGDLLLAPVLVGDRAGETVLVGEQPLGGVQVGEVGAGS